MARMKNIWRRKPRRPGDQPHWYTTQGRKKIKVADASKTKTEAWVIFCATFSAPPPQEILVKDVLNRYLRYIEKNHPASTHKNYRRPLVTFASRLSDRLTVIRLKNHMVQEWLDYHEEWASTTKNTAVKVLKAALNWAVDQDYILANPVARFKAPRRENRELWLDDTEFKRLLSFVTDAFADFLTFSFEVGSRPQETRILTAKHFDGEKFILTKKESKGKKRSRVIYPNARMIELVKRLIARYPTGPIFRNEDGNPWKTSAVACRFLRRNRKGISIGLAAKMEMPGLCAYTLRHSFCTNALIRGVSVIDVARLMGHKDATMVMRVYEHLIKEHALLQRAANQAVGLPIAIVPIASRLTAAGSGIA